MDRGRLRFDEVADGFPPEEWRQHLGVGIILGLSVGLAAIHVSHLLGTSESALSLALGAVIPLAFTVLLAIAGSGLPWTGYDDLALRIGVWCVIGTTLLFGISFVTIQYQRSLGVELRNVLFVVAGSATGGAIVGFLIGVYDAERQMTERRLTDEREMARRLSQRLSVLNRVLRHDIRNDVNVIHGNARLLLNGTESPEVPARTIKEKASKLHRMSESARKIESLLDRDELPTEAIDLATLVKTKVLRIERDYSRVRTETSIPDTAWASASPMIESAVENVLENAVEHNDADSPVVWIDLSIDRDTIELTVEDNGPGLPEDEVRVLERGHETELEHASGLGLWLVNWIVSESGGDVEFRERDPSGSVVVVTLPRSDPPEGEANPQ